MVSDSSSLSFPGSTVLPRCSIVPVLSSIPSLPARCSSHAPASARVASVVREGGAPAERVPPTTGSQRHRSVERKDALSRAQQRCGPDGARSPPVVTCRPRFVRKASAASSSRGSDGSGTAAACLRWPLCVSPMPCTGYEARRCSPFARPRAQHSASGRRWRSRKVRREAHGTHRGARRLTKGGALYPIERIQVEPGAGLRLTSARRCGKVDAALVEEGTIEAVFIYETVSLLGVSTHLGLRIGGAAAIHVLLKVSTNGCCDARHPGRATADTTPTFARAPSASDAAHGAAHRGPTGRVPGARRLRERYHPGRLGAETRVCVCVGRRAAARKKGL